MNCQTSVTFGIDVVFFGPTLKSCSTDGQHAKKEPWSSEIGCKQAGTLTRRWASAKSGRADSIHGRAVWPNAPSHGYYAVLLIRQDADHKQAGQRVLQTALMPLIGNCLQTDIQCIQVKHQRFLGKRENTQKCCIVHRRAFRQENVIVSFIWPVVSFCPK